MLIFNSFTGLAMESDISNNYRINLEKLVIEEDLFKAVPKHSTLKRMLLSEISIEPFKVLLYGDENPLCSDEYQFQLMPSKVFSLCISEYGLHHELRNEKFSLHSSGCFAVIISFDPNDRNYLRTIEKKCEKLSQNNIRVPIFWVISGHALDANLNHLLLEEFAKKHSNLIFLKPEEENKLLNSLLLLAKEIFILKTINRPSLNSAILKATDKYIKKRIGLKKNLRKRCSKKWPVKINDEKCLLQLFGFLNSAQGNELNGFKSLVVSSLFGFNPETNEEAIAQIYWLNNYLKHSSLVNNIMLEKLMLLTILVENHNMIKELSDMIIDNFIKLNS